MALKIKGAIFDWAGTTIDYGCFAPLRGFIDGFKKYGVDITMEEARKPMGLLKIDHTRAIAGFPRVREEFKRVNGREITEEDVLAIYNVFQTTLMSNILNYSTCKEDVVETVNKLRARGLKIGSTTGYTREMMNKIIEKVAQQGYSPDSCVCADEVPKGRPDPFMVWRNLTSMGISNPRECVKIGDTVSDIKEGTNANMWAVGVIMGSSELGLTEEEVAKLSPAELDAHKKRVSKIYYEAGADYVIDTMVGLINVIENIERRMKQNEPHLLLTPGPLTTKDSVKNAMLADHCTWDDEYKEITTQVMNDITHISANDSYVTVLLQGSGSYAVEAMIQSFTDDNEEILFVVNGEYGKRMVTQATNAGKKFSVLEFDMCTAVDPAAVEARLTENPAIKYVFVVHSETTTGLINPINEIVPIAKKHGKQIFIDAMSSFAAYEINMVDLGIDAVAASANKCLEGLPGLGFVIAKKTVVEASKGRSKSHCLDIYDQYLSLYPGGGKFRFTSPTNILLALQQAILEYKHEGGLEARRARYIENHKHLVEGMNKIGIKSIIDPKWQSYIITTFELGSINFSGMYNALKEQGFVIYPGKLTNHPTFRIGTIGNIYPQQIDRLCNLISEYINHNK